MQYLLPALFVLSLNALSAQGNRPELRYDPNSGRFSILNLPDPKATGIQEYRDKPGFWGIYFWDFGDGTYQLFDREKHTTDIPMPTHKYAVSKPYKATLYLTPFYSFTKPVSLECSIPVPAKGTPDTEKDMDGKLVNIATSTDNRIIPGQDARIAIHYEAPADGAGTLLLFYGKNTGIKKKVGDPMKVHTEGLYYNELKYNGVAGERIKKMTGDVVPTLMQLMATYPHVHLYDVPAMKKGEQRRLFFTLHSNEKLETSRTANINLYITAVWVPSGASFKRSTMLREMKFSLPPVHDPNNIIGPRRMYYRKGQPKQLEYEVNFLNIAKGVVRDVTVVLPAQGFDPQSVKVVPGQMEPPCKKCPEVNYRDSFCYRLKPYPDSIVMTLYNIGLQPKKGLFNKKHSKGSFVITVNSDGQFRPRTNTKAKIVFLGAEALLTRPSITQWRHRALYLEPGYTFGLNQQTVPTELDTAGNKALRRFNMAIGYQNAPLGRGLVWGWEAGVNRQHFFQDTTLTLSETINDEFSNATLYQTEVFDIWYLDAKAVAGYQLTPFFRFSGGVGTSIPMLARMDARANITTQQGSPYTASGSKQYGLFQNRDEKVFLFNQPLENRPSPGISAQWGFEVGAMNTASFGFEHQLRFFPNFYKKGCATLSNLNVYVRFKIAPLVSKSL